MPGHAVRSLVYVTEEGVAVIRELSAKLKSAKNPRQVTTLLTALAKEASALSGAVEKLGGYDEVLEDRPAINELDPSRIEVARHLLRMTTSVLNSVSVQTAEVFCVKSVKASWV